MVEDGPLVQLVSSLNYDGLTFKVKAIVASQNPFPPVLSPVGKGRHMAEISVSSRHSNKRNLQELSKVNNS